MRQSILVVALGPRKRNVQGLSCSTGCGARRFGQAGRRRRVTPGGAPGAVRPLGPRDMVGRWRRRLRCTLTTGQMPRSAGCGISWPRLACRAWRRGPTAGTARTCPWPSPMAFHADVNAALGGGRVRHWDYYLPGNWIPHCTLAEGLGNRKLRGRSGSCTDMSPSLPLSRRLASKTSRAASSRR